MEFITNLDNFDTEHRFITWKIMLIMCCFQVQNVIILDCLTMHALEFFFIRSYDYLNFIVHNIDLSFLCLFAFLISKKYMLSIENHL
jgi:hypothetical protein